MMKLYAIYKPINGKREHIGSLHASTPKNAITRYMFSAGTGAGLQDEVVKMKYTAKLLKNNKTK